jgi:hypothetical protein
MFAFFPSMVMQVSVFKIKLIIDMNKGYGYAKFQVITAPLSQFSNFDCYIWLIAQYM